MEGKSEGIHIPVTPVLRRLMPEDTEFAVHLSYRDCLREKRKGEEEKEDSIKK